MLVNFLRNHPMLIVLLVGSGAVFAVLLTMIDGGLLKSQVAGQSDTETLTYSCEILETLGIPEATLSDIAFRDGAANYVNASAVCNLRVDCRIRTLPDATCENLTSSSELTPSPGYMCEEVTYSIAYPGSPTRASSAPDGNTDEVVVGAVQNGTTVAQLTDADKRLLVRRMQEACNSKLYIPAHSDNYYGELCENRVPATAREELENQTNLTVECKRPITPSSEINEPLPSPEESTEPQETEINEPLPS